MYDYERIYGKIKELRKNAEDSIVPYSDNEIWEDDIEVLNPIAKLVKEHEQQKKNKEAQ